VVHGAQPGLNRLLVFCSGSSSSLLQRPVLLPCVQSPTCLCILSGNGYMHGSLRMLLQRDFLCRFESVSGLILGPILVTTELDVEGRIGRTAHGATHPIRSHIQPRKLFLQVHQRLSTCPRGEHDTGSVCLRLLPLQCVFA
jgi:hypothetical protein